MNFRYHLAARIDPGMADEIADLRDRAAESAAKYQALRKIVDDMRAQRAVETAIAEARVADAELEARNARADVARLLEDAARCAHEHTN